ncbi:MAG: 30S ribosomal protein S9 [Candidatus Paceibacterota bacterium]
MAEDLKLGIVKVKEPRKRKAAAPKAEAADNGKYIEAVGRRKTSTARVRMFSTGDKSITVNGKDYKDYFRDLVMQTEVVSPLEVMKVSDKYKFTVMVQGGGMHSQAQAVRHGIARALEVFNSEFRKRLKKVGFLTRDSRMRERKKFGLKRARRAPQWAKR